ncbi:MAG TPA: hypothetical protein VFK57_22900 [Vicinamibacterales bacterium]|nr:hypothetical protein [Vicinamibacterales bacterium]
MGRIFRAFLWMRFRVLVNSLERTGARDTLERFSVATEKLGPIMAMVLLIPTSIFLLILGMTAGFGLATGDWLVTMELIRYFLLLALALTLIGPIVLPTRDSGSVIRLLLLPIPRLGLYIGQMGGAIADPWIVLIVPVVIGVPIGLAVGLKFAAAAIALLAGVAFMLFVMGLTSLASSFVHLLLRDRRRGDIVMLVVVLIIPLIAMAPQFLLRQEREGGRRLTRAERAALPPTRLERLAVRSLPYIPSEMYRHATVGGTRSPLEGFPPLASLVLIAFGVQAAGFVAYRRVLDMPVSLGARRAGSFGGLWDRVVPGLSPGASAVAMTQLRLALRTPRGRASIGSALLMPLLLGGLAYRSGRMPLPGLDGQNGLGLAAFGTFASLLALIPLAMNQFAIDKAGFTRQMLLPLSVHELLLGKAVGNGLTAAIPGVFCLLIPALMFSPGPLGPWAALVLAVIATYALIAPAAAALSAVFPKTVDLNSIGNSSNAHQAAGLLGMLAFAAAIAPPALFTVLALRLMQRPDLVPLLMLGWCVLALCVSYLLFIPVRRLVESRRETLAQYY